MLAHLVSFFVLCFVDFGIDTGYNYNGVTENKPCRTDRDDTGAYNNEYPMAVYYPGQKVVIAHPTKVC